MPPLIEIDRLTHRYPLPGSQPQSGGNPRLGGNPRTQAGEIVALRDISLKIEAGEHLAILGANGSGKTTLARTLNALLIPSEGRVAVTGLDTRDPANHPAIRRTVGMVLQYPEDQIVATGVEEDVAFGLENLGLPPHEIRRQVELALRQVGLWELRQRPPYLLSAGQMQRVALAGVLAVRPRLIVFDEATAMLDPAGRKMVLGMMDRLRQEGMAIVTITHFMSDALHADRVIALSHGEIALEGAPAQIFAQGDRLRELGLDVPPAVRVAVALHPLFPNLPEGLLTVEDLLAALPDYPAAAGQALPMLAPSLTEPEPPFIDVTDLGHVYLRGTPLAQRALQRANLRVAQGSAHGILGATGSGKSTLLQHLNGLLRPQEGRVRIGAYDLGDPRLDIRLVRRMAGLVGQIPEAQFFEQYAGDEIAYGPRLLGRAETLRDDVRWAMEMVGLDFERFKDRLTFTLSGGERRKVALASILAIRPQILLLDEPMAGMDPTSRAELLRHLQEMRSTGLTLALSSHHMEDMAALAERLTVFASGRDVLSGTVQEVFAQGAALDGLGLEPSASARVAAGMRRKGWPVPAGLPTPEALAAALARVMAPPRNGIAGAAPGPTPGKFSDLDRGERFAPQDSSGAGSPPSASPLPRESRSKPVTEAKDAAQPGKRSAGQARRQAGRG